MFIINPYKNSVKGYFVIFTNFYITNSIGIKFFIFELSTPLNPFKIFYLPFIMQF